MKFRSLGKYRKTKTALGWGCWGGAGCRIGSGMTARAGRVFKGWKPPG